MSHYSSLKTIIKRKSSLIKALESIDAGKWKGKLEIHEKAVALYGYGGDARPEKANIIIRRKDVGSSSNDIGFVKREDGSYEAIISDYDSRVHNSNWLKKLQREYSKETIVEVAEEQGFSWTEHRSGNEIFVECTSNY